MRIKPIDFMAIMGRSKLIFIFMRCCSYGVRGNSTETMEDKILRIVTNHPLANDGKCDIMKSPQMSRSA